MIIIPVSEVEIVFEQLNYLLQLEESEKLYPRNSSVRRIGITNTECHFVAAPRSGPARSATDIACGATCGSQVFTSQAQETGA
jgi:hypothetical protein